MPHLEMEKGDLEREREGEWVKKEYGKEKQGEGEKVEEECGGREWKWKN